LPIYNTSQRVREIHVPKDYKTSTGALNKSRALQYCWEDSVNLYSDEEWIVHLDEETLVTEESIKGTFLSEGTEKPKLKCLGFTYNEAKLYNMLPLQMREKKPNTFKIMTQDRIWNNIKTYS
jgi:egghead protein (zeste-white 4 protein)